MRRFKILKQHINRYGWTLASRYLYKNTQDQLRDECTRVYNENWENLIKDTQDKYKDAKSFWQNIKRLMGSNDTQTPYLAKQNGDRVYSDENKLKLFHEIWTNIFRISNEENRDFEQNTENRVNEYLREIADRIKPYPHSDLSRLVENSPLLKPMNMGDLKRIMAGMKNKAPGNSGIRKSIMEKCPDIVLIKYMELINHTLSLAYFPKIIKYAILRLIAKDGKDPKNPINYRPISLLEFPGKIFERLINERLTKYLEENSNGITTNMHSEKAEELSRPLLPYMKR